VPRPGAEVSAPFVLREKSGARAAMRRGRPGNRLDPIGDRSAAAKSAEKAMFAIIRTGGKQYRVAEQDLITVDKISGKAGDAVRFGEVLLLGGETIAVGSPMVAGATVAGELVEQARGEKVIAFKKRRRKNSRRKRGHRQEFSVIRITEILTEGRKPAARTEAAPRVEAAPQAARAEPSAPAPQPAPEPAAAAPPAPQAEAKPAPAKKAEAKPPPPPPPAPTAKTEARPAKPKAAAKPAKKEAAKPKAEKPAAPAKKPAAKKPAADKGKGKKK
jgi:large subunit ribosomal protein L21